MKLENQVVSLELAKEMKELGFEQESLFWYLPEINKDGKIIYHPQWFQPDEEYISSIKNSILNKDNNEFNIDLYSAYNASELLLLLPPYISTEDYDCPLKIIKEDSSYWVYYEMRNYLSYEEFNEINLCDALAQMLIYLKKNNLI